MTNEKRGCKFIVMLLKLLRPIFWVLFLILFAFLVYRFLPLQTANQVIVYVSHDQDYAQPILEEFEKETKIKVKAVYDTEASKTVGLTNRLIAEKNNPQADVFWNNEVVRSVQLKKEEVLDIYKPDRYEEIDIIHKDPQGYWTGFAARARVLIAHSNYINKANKPSSLEDLMKSEYKDHVTIADPRFGTTGPHLAALLTIWGETKFREYLKSMKDNKVDIAQSNGQTRDKVASGEEWVGFTDTDDANDALIDKKPVIMIYPDQGVEDIGTLIIPNSVMLIKSAKHQEAAKRLINYLVSPGVESKLSYAKSAQMPLLKDVDRPSNVKDVRSIKSMDIEWERVYNNLQPALSIASEYLLR